MRVLAFAIICCTCGLSAAAPAAALSPEQFYEPGPEARELRLEHNSQVALTRGAPPPHSLELFGGLTDQLSLGLEIEGEVEDGRLRVEEAGLGTIFNLTDDDAPVDVAVLVEAGVGLESGKLQLESRLVLARETGPLQLLGNIILRRANEDDDKETTLAYAMLAHHEITGNLFVGVEASGQVWQQGSSAEPGARAHYVGPSLGLSIPIASERLQLGMKYLYRIEGRSGREQTLRVTTSLEF